MRKGICCAGNMMVDITYPISDWPRQGELVHITEGISRSPGGAVCNTIADLARLDPTLRLMASGVLGDDAGAQIYGLLHHQRTGGPADHRRAAARRGGDAAPGKHGARA